MTHIKVYRVTPEERHVGDIIDGEPTTNELAWILDDIGIDPTDEDEVFGNLSGPTIIAREAANPADDEDA